MCGGPGLRAIGLAALALALAPAGATAARTLPPADACLSPQTPPGGFISVSPNVEHVGTLMGEAGGVNAGGRVVGHHSTSRARRTSRSTTSPTRCTRS